LVTLAGAGDSLFHFGDRDGVASQARFQHPLGVVAVAGMLYVADTYNSAIRVVDPRTGTTRTLAGGKPGWRDGKHPLFYEPGGIDTAGGTLYVADTNNHSIRTVDIATGAASTLVLKGVSLLAAGDSFPGGVVRLAPRSVGPGSGSLRLDVAFPDGFGPNPQAPSEVTVASSSEGAVHFPGPNTFSGAGPRFPMVFPAVFTAGTGDVGIDLLLVYCREERAAVCMIARQRLEVPVRVVGAGTPNAPKPVLDVHYKVR
jgi:hypothetical protein